MGILVQDAKTFNNGLTLNGFVATIRGSIREVQKLSGTSYRVSYRVFYYATEQAYTSNMSPVDDEVKQLELTEAQINGDLFGLIYQAIGSAYQNVSQI